ncbi:MAG: hypothetical protein R3E96_05265 [Planctomycetota bacterium]
MLSHTDREGNGNEGRLHVPIRGLVVDPIVLRPHPWPSRRCKAGQSLTIAATVQGLAPGNLLHMNAVRIEGPSAPT